MARLVLLCVAVLGLVTLPFVLAGEPIEVRSMDWLWAAAGHPRLAASMVVALLVADILLPIPSSVVSTTGGVLLGFTGGFVASLAGTTGGAVAAYWLGRSAGPWTRRVAKDSGSRELNDALRRHGDWLIVASRPIPVLAESIPLFAGMTRMSFARFFCLATLANIGMSAIYAFVGAFAADVNSFLLAFAAAVVVPLGPMLWLRRASREQHKHPTPE
jgi:uncharacterized membrane protein YdjX (TVP38/TMEM64 family)